MYLKLLLSALALIALSGCGDSEDSATPGSKSIAECISGTYLGGSADFTNWGWGSASYQLEVGTNGREVILLATATETTGGTKNGTQICSIYKNFSFPNFEANDERFAGSSDFVSETIEDKGKISDSIGIRVTEVSRDDGQCSLNSLHTLVRTGSGSIAHGESSGTTKQLVETRSFSEIKSDCDKLPVASVQ